MNGTQKKQKIVGVAVFALLIATALGSLLALLFPEAFQRWSWARVYSSAFYTSDVVLCFVAAMGLAVRRLWAKYLTVFLFLVAGFINTNLSLYSVLLGGTDNFGTGELTGFLLGALYFGVVIWLFIATGTSESLSALPLVVGQVVEKHTRSTLKAIEKFGISVVASILCLFLLVLAIDAYVLPDLNLERVKSRTEPLLPIDTTFAYDGGTQYYFGMTYFIRDGRENSFQKTDVDLQYTIDFPFRDEKQIYKIDNEYGFHWFWEVWGLRENMVRGGIETKS